MNKINRNSFALLVALLSFFLSSQAEAQHVVFNEIMQSNVDGLMVKKDFPDSWLELYNTQSKAYNLKGWRIGLTNDFDAAWSFRNSMTIFANDYLLVYCDQVDNGYTHTDFHLDAKKCTLYLWDAQGNLVDSLHHKKQPAPNVAYGRTTDGGEEWDYEVTPTPGAANAGTFTSLMLPDPLFSTPGCVRTNASSGSVNLTISIPSADELTEEETLPADARLYVTLDGSAPTFDSPSYGPDEPCQLTLTSTTVVRARLLSSDALAALPVTHSYIFHPRDLALPVFSFSTNGEYLYDEEIGMLLGTDYSGNCYKGWRRPFNIEYFEPTDYIHSLINQVGEAGMHGAGSLSHKQKAMNVYTNKRWQKKRFDSSTFWPEKPQITKTKTFCVRNGGSRCLDSRMEDAFVQRLFAQHVDSLQYLAYRPCIVYINGVYRGLYGLRERANHTWAENNRDVPEDVTNEVESFYDGCEAYAPVKALIDSGTATYADYCRYLDMPLLINYLCCEAFATNTLFPHSNAFLWQDPTGEDTRIHPLLKDLDALAETANSTNWFNFISLTGKEGTWAGAFEHRRIFEQLFEMTDFRQDFVGHMQVYLGDFCKPSVSVALVNAMRAEIDSEVAATFAAIDEGATYADFDNRITQLLIPYCQNRPMIHYQHLTDRFGLGNVVPLTVQNHVQTEGAPCVRINGIPLTEGDFEGACFSQFSTMLETGSLDYGWIRTLTFTDGTTQTDRLANSTTTLLLADMTKEVASVQLAPYYRPIDSHDVYLTFSSDGVSCSNPYEGSGVEITTSSNHVQIVSHTFEEVTYRLSGNATDASVSLQSNKPWTFLLEGLTLQSENGAVLSCNSNVPGVISVTDGSQNRLVSTALEQDRDQPLAAIQSVGNLSLEGTGSLAIETSGKAGRCIASTRNLSLSGLTLAVTNRSKGQKEYGKIWDCAAIYCGGNLTISDGSYTVLSTGPAGKGICTVGSVTLGDKEQPELGPDLKLEITGTTMYVSSDQGTLTAGCPAIVANGAIDIYGTTHMTASSIDNSGNGLKSYTAINIHGGELSFNCYDDCINCPGPIAFYGGTTTCYSYHDDAIDSDFPYEGAILLAGGNLFSYSTNMPTSEGIDCDDNMKILITGGIVVTAGGAQHPDSRYVGDATQGYYVGPGLVDCDKEQYYSLVGADGQVICTYRFQETFANRQSIITAPNLGYGDFRIVHGPAAPYGYTEEVGGCFWLGGYTDNTETLWLQTSNASGIDALSSEPAHLTHTFSVTGTLCTPTTSGLVIERYDDGTVRKSLIP